MLVEDSTICESACEGCGILSVDQMLDLHYTKWDEKKAEEHKATFLDALKGLDAAKK
jgi:hypothetical protein